MLSVQSPLLIAGGVWLRGVHIEMSKVDFCFQRGLLREDAGYTNNITEFTE